MKKKKKIFSGIRGEIFTVAPHRMLSKKDSIRFNRQKAKQNWKREVCE